MGIVHNTTLQVNIEAFTITDRTYIYDISISMTDDYVDLKRLMIENVEQANPNKAYTTEPESHESILLVGTTH